MEGDLAGLAETLEGQLRVHVRRWPLPNVADSDETDAGSEVLHVERNSRQDRKQAGAAHLADHAPCRDRVTERDENERHVRDD